jgi:molybdopterin-containing oxidoreductase family iron-sulfur binding subunit
VSESGIGRRFFLRVLGATGVAAGCSPAHAPEKLIPLLNPPENMVPGKPLFYRTVCRECEAGCGATARSREGRVIKLEGNPDEPTSSGALCARGQAALQGLYAPDRFRGPMLRGADGRLAPISWTDALAKLSDAIKAAPGGSVRLVTRSEPGSAGAIQRAFVAAVGGRRAVVEPPPRSALRAACARLFGSPEVPGYELGTASAVVSFDADFAETWLSPVALARGFASGRGKPAAVRSSFTWVGPRLGATGAVADEWIPCKPGQELDLALQLLRWLTDPANGVGGLAPEAEVVREALGTRAAAPSAQIERLGRTLASRRPSVLLGSGTPELAAILLVANHLLGNVGRTVLLGQDALGDPPVEPLPDGARVLMLHHAAPPAGAAQVPLVVAFSNRPDAAADLAHLVLPDHHWLEAFGDVEARKGVLALAQPAMTPLWDTRAASDVLLQLGKQLGLQGLPAGKLESVSRKRASARASELGAMPPEGERGLQMRGVASAPASHQDRPIERDAILAALRVVPTAPSALTILAFPTALAAADPQAPSWLREVPDAVSGVCWSSWVELAPADAARIGAGDGDLISIVTAGGTAELPLSVHPGLCEGTVAVPRGAPELDRLRGAVQLRRVGKGVLPRIPGVPRDEGRGLLPSAAAVAQREEHEHGHEHHHDRGIGYEHPPDEHPYGMRPAPSHPSHRWAMAIDLDRCTGCQACVVACYAENNVPVNGPEAAQKGRNQAWLRIQRNLSSGPATRIEFLPSLCQHCDRAPCEPVCPVYATYHTSEGLNAMVYNRCIGTRYCSNNCPYDARVFNWRDPIFEAPLQLQLNPDVTVRSKGVMEKCTFCVQRIRFAENEAKSERRSVLDGEVVPACAQTCPAQAITFGDLEDPASRINRVKQDQRAYRLLEELATGPAVTYLARGGNS